MEDTVVVYTVYRMFSISKRQNVFDGIEYTFWYGIKILFLVGFPTHAHTHHNTFIYTIVYITPWISIENENTVKRQENILTVIITRENRNPQWFCQNKYRSYLSLFSPKILHNSACFLFEWIIDINILFVI